MDERGTIFGASTLAFGRGTKYGPQSFAGLDYPPLRTSDSPRSGDHGSYGGDDYLDERNVVIDMRLKGTSKADFDSLLAALSASMVMQPRDIILSLDNGNRVVFCRPRGEQGDRNYRDLGQRGVRRVRFDAKDARIYEGTMQNIVASLPLSTGGFVPPLIPPLALGAASGGGSLTATNSGPFECRPIAVITNCVAINPRIENVTAGKLIKLNLTLNASDILVIDFDGKTVDIVSGVAPTFDSMKTAGLTNPASRRSVLDPSSKWWVLAPGANAIRFTADTYDANARMTLTWRSAYLSI